MQTINLTREKIYQLLQEQDGKFFSVVFRKKNGQLRKINGRLGVTKYLRGGANKVMRYDNPYETVFECSALDYRTANLHTVEKVYANKCVYKVVEA